MKKGWKWLSWPLAVICIAGGIYLTIDMGRRALTGERDAIGLLVSFTVMIVLIVFGIRKFWTVILDERDALDIFKEFAISRDARIRHIRREIPVDKGTAVENGYVLNYTDHGHGIEMALMHVGKKSESSKSLSDEHDLFMIRIDTGYDLDLSVVNPQYEIENTLDVEMYSPRILSSKKYYYYQHGLIFADYDKAHIDRLFDHSFIQIQLFALFVNFRFKLVVFQDRRVLAVKAASMQSMHLDVDSYTALINLARVLADQNRKSQEMALS